MIHPNKYSSFLFLFTADKIIYLLLQGFNKAGICGAMVDAAAHWIRAGLPLRCLKIVLYEGINKEIETMFSALRVKLTAQNEKLKVCKGHVFENSIPRSDCSLGAV